MARTAASTSTAIPVSSCSQCRRLDGQGRVQEPRAAPPLVRVRQGRGLNEARIPRCVDPTAADRTPGGAHVDVLFPCEQDRCLPLCVSCTRAHGRAYVGRTQDRPPRQAFGGRSQGSLRSHRSGDIRNTGPGERHISVGEGSWTEPSKCCDACLAATSRFVCSDGSESGRSARSSLPTADPSDLLRVGGFAEVVAVWPIQAVPDHHSSVSGPAGACRAYQGAAAE